ncbi:acyloxyacyl hydrolase [Desulfobaculum bizertense]|uniref:Lipid A 3-O-deacylase n=1 Tax=Desulfobaculum bizertense DSM 18034 TaxID=1121442 RepID=A0A1T4VYZ0_9BACT|nr:acyloxyacyl hydrolase [Desulfobaculum bizertense]SKA70234.1 lipid A 3-O-deacylase [Desulfobaculum bizertense DSM 18034]
MKLIVYVLCIAFVVFQQIPVAYSENLVSISELRIGVLAHDLGVTGKSREDGVDVNGEVLFKEFQGRAWEAIGSPRLHLGGGLHSEGKTSQAYAGLTWTYDFYPKIFIEGAFGGAIHTGKLSSHDPDEQRLGSRGLFRLHAGIGYKFTKHIATLLSYDHISNANLASPNPGLDRAGLSLCYSF